MSSTEFFCIKVVFLSARAGHPFERGHPLPRQAKKFFGGSGHHFSGFEKMGLETETPEGHQSAFRQKQELWSAVRQGVGILAEAVPARAGRSTTEKNEGEPRRCMEAPGKHPANSMKHSMCAANGAE
jgi:hypothetical protein